MPGRTEELTRPNKQSPARPFGIDPASSLPFSSPLPPATLNIEEKSRSNLLPWRGQFSPQLVEALLRAYSPPGSVVLDPFMGSGTVLVESARLGLPAYGYEVNPAAFLVTRVYELCNVSADGRRELLSSAEAILTKARPTAFELPLFHTESRTTSPKNTDIDYGWIRSIHDPQVRMLLEALVVLLNEDGTRDEAFAGWWSTIRQIVTDLPFSKAPIHPGLGDARSLPLPNASIDFVLSSPPYINVFNYHHNSRKGIEALGWKPLVVARSEIGSNRKFRQNRFLTVVQYCIDMALTLVELRRVCADSARILLILGRESNVHKTAFYNSEILKRIAVDIVGFRLHQRQERVFLNRFGQSIYEDLLHLSPESGYSLPKEMVVERARNVGKNVLLEAVERTPRDRQCYLHDAIARAGRIEASPILEPAAAFGGSL